MLRLVALTLVATASSQELTSQEGTIVARSANGRRAQMLMGNRNTLPPEKKPRGLKRGFRWRSLQTAEVSLAPLHWSHTASTHTPHLTWPGPCCLCFHRGRGSGEIQGWVPLFCRFLLLRLEEDLLSARLFYGTQ